MHDEAWRVINAKKEEELAGKVEALRVRCAELLPGAPATDTTVSADVIELRSQLLSLQEHGQARELDMQNSMQEQVRVQTDAHAALVAENNTRFESAILRWQRHCDGLSAQLSKHSEATIPMSPIETDQRLADAQAKKSALAEPMLADGAARGGSAAAMASARQAANGILA